MGLSEANYLEAWHAHRHHQIARMVRTTHNRDLAQELVDDAWMRAWAARHQWQPLATPATWVWRIATNLLHTHWRTRAAHTTLTPLDDTRRPLADPAATAAVDRIVDRLTATQLLPVAQAALSACAPRQRIVMALTIAGLTDAQISQETGMGLDAVRQARRQARRKIITTLNGME